MTDYQTLHQIIEKDFEDWLYHAYGIMLCPLTNRFKYRSFEIR